MANKKKKKKASQRNNSQSNAASSSKAVTTKTAEAQKPSSKSSKSTAKDAAAKASSAKGVSKYRDAKAEREKEKAKAAKAKEKKKKAGKPGAFTRIRNYFSDVRSEMRRVTWPSKKELVNYSVVVCVSLIVVGVVIAALDFVITEGLFLFSGLRG